MEKNYWSTRWSNIWVTLSIVKHQALRTRISFLYMIMQWLVCQDKEVEDPHGVCQLTEFLRRLRARLCMSSHSHEASGPVPPPVYFNEFISLISLTLALSLCLWALLMLVLAGYRKLNYVQIWKCKWESWIFLGLLLLAQAYKWEKVGCKQTG